MAILNGGFPGGGGAAEEVYSTEETRIGTWIDGKPLYRKVIEVSIGPADNSASNIAHGISNLETIAILTACVTDVYGNVISVPYYQDYSGTHQSLTVYSNANKIELTLYVYNSYNGGLSKRPWTIIIEYTKATDTTPTSTLSASPSTVRAPSILPTAAVTAAEAEI